MANNSGKTKVITGTGARLSYFQGWEPVSINGGAEKYSVSVLIPTSCLLGYAKDENGKLVIVPEEAEVVKRIYREYLDGASLMQIKRGLRLTAYRTARSTPSGMTRISGRFLRTKSTSATRFFRKPIRSASSTKSAAATTERCRNTMLKAAMNPHHRPRGVSPGTGRNGAAYKSAKQGQAENVQFQIRSLRHRFLSALRRQLQTGGLQGCKNNIAIRVCRL